MEKVSLREARRIVVAAHRLAAPKPKTILEVVRGSGPLQLDPTNAVARSERLVLWSRLGRYDVAELDRLLWEERRLFQWRAFIYRVEDWPLVQSAARRFPSRDRERARKVREWLADNASFQRYVLAELRKRGPLPQRELEDRSVRPWESTGWTANKNLSQLLEFLSGQGKVLIAGRDGQERLWDLADRVVPPAKAVPTKEAARIEVLRRFRALGLATESGFWRTVALWLLPLVDAFRELVREGALVPVTIEGLRGTYYAHPDALEAGPFRGRTTLLSPFDPLIYDRKRTLELFGFRYRLEIYVPVAKREFGYFVLPILHGERLVGRIDPFFDRKAGVLRVNAVHWENEPVPQALRAVDELARWLGAESVDYA